MAGSKRKKVGVDDRVPVELTLEQRDLILDHTFADPDLTAPLRMMRLRESALLSAIRSRTSSS
jgi:hypothetical protein